MPRFAANLSLLFTELPFLERFEAASRAGFKGVEFLFPYDFAVGELRARLDDHGLQLVLFNLPPGDWDAGERGLAAVAGREDEFSRGVDQALDFANELGCGRLHAMAGLKPHGAHRATYIENLGMACERAKPCGVDILIEPINTKDFPGYFLNNTFEAARVIEEVGASNLGLQFDLYHRFLMEGEVEQGLKDFAHLARHYQVAGPPDRGEPFPSDMDCANLFQMIDRSGFNGWIGCEYKPRAGTLSGLQWIEDCGVTLEV